MLTRRTGAAAGRGKDAEVGNMPLTMAQVGTELSVARINGRDETRRFLENLGFVEGSPVTVVSELGGNLIVSVKDTRVALSRAMANRIIIAA